MNSVTSPPVATVPYRTVFCITALQRTSLSIGGSHDANAVTDMPVARDGMNRLILRGTSLAGDLIATARTLVKQLPDTITRGEKQTSMTPSSWDVSNAHLVGAEPVLELRTGSAHRQDTRATGQSGLFDYEVIPPGAQWQFIVEVIHQRAGKDDASLLAHILSECQQGRFWLGRKVSRGLGWLDLVACDVFELPTTEPVVDGWPNSKLKSEELVNYLKSLVDKKPIPALNLETYLSHSKFSLCPQRAYLRWSGTIQVGAYQPDPKGKTYGLDALSIGAHGSFVPDAECFGESHLVNATDQPWGTYQKDFAPDMALAMVRRYDGWEPFIPGSAIAGSLRHWLSRAVRIGGKDMVWDPVAQESYVTDESGFDIDKDPVANLMGYVRHTDQAEARDSRLLVPECYLVEESRANWKAALGEKVALDEFTQGPFETSKFNRLAVLEAKFAFQIVQEVNLPADCDIHKLCQRESILLEQALSAAKDRRIGLGGGEFRAYGHVGFDVDKTEFAIAGNAWETWPAVNLADIGADTNAMPTVDPKIQEGVL